MDGGIQWSELFSLHAMSVFEIGMLVCFAASWPAAILRTFLSKNPGGKSVLFAVLVIIGYLCGATHKVLYKPDLVFWLYLFNTLLVGTDLVLVLIYRRRQRLAEGE